MDRVFLILAAALFVWVGLEFVTIRLGKVGLAAVAGIAVALFLAVAATASMLAIAQIYSLRAVWCCMLALTLTAKVVLWRACKLPLVSLQWLQTTWREKKMPAITGLLVAAVLAVIGILNALYPTTYYYGGRDYGIYMIDAVYISQHGTMLVESDEFLNENYEELQNFVQLGYPAYDSTYGRGNSENPGDFSPQFLAAYPAVLAVAFDVGGFTLLTRVNGLIQLLCAVVLYYFAKRFLGRRTAEIATVFYMVCPALMWSARITQSEQLTGLLFLAASYCLAVGWEKDKTGWLLLAGGMLGYTCFVRIDSYVLLIGIYAVTCYAAIWQRPKLKRMMAASALASVLGGLSVWYGLAQHHAYFYGHYATGQLRLLLWGAGGALLLTVVVCAVGGLFKPNPPPVLVAIGASKKLVCALGGALFALAAYAYWVRPLFKDHFAATSLREYSWYVSPLAYLLAIVGIMALLYTPVKQKIHTVAEPLLYFLATGLGSIIMYTWRPSITRDHFWASRRWITVNFVFVLLLAAHGIAQVWERAAASPKTKRVVLRVVSGGAALLVCGSMLWNTRLFINTRMLGGLTSMYDEAAAHLPDDTLILAKNADIASVFRWDYDKNLYLYSIRDTGYDDLRQYLDEHGEFYIVGDPTMAWLVGNTELVYEGRVAGLYPRETIGAYPTELITRVDSASVWRVTPYAEGRKPEIDVLRYVRVDVPAERMEDGSVHGTGEGQFIYGPYLELEQGRYRVEIELSSLHEVQMEFEILGHNDAGEYSSQTQSFFEDGLFVYEFAMDAHLHNVEMRVYNRGGQEVDITLHSFTLQKVD